MKNHITLSSSITAEIVIGFHVELENYTKQEIDEKYTNEIIDLITEEFEGYLIGSVKLCFSGYREQLKYFNIGFEIIDIDMDDLDTFTKELKQLLENNLNVKLEEFI